MTKEINLSGHEETLKPIITQFIALYQLLEDRDIGDVYGIPVEEFQRDVRMKPQIKLYFKEPYIYEKHKDGLARVTAEITFRIANKTSATITRNDAIEYAREIKREFATPVFSWQKGKYKCTYIDMENGYDLRLLCVSKAEGIRVVRSVLKILDKTFDDDYFQFIENTKEFPEKPGTHKVYGKIVRKFRQRPTAIVKFSYAQLLIPGQLKPIDLVSVNGRKKSAIEKVTST